MAVEIGILHETGALARRFVVLALIGLLPAQAPATALFDDDEIIEIRLSGPLGTISRERQHRERTEYPFVLSVNGSEIPVEVRVRGKSRTEACVFPPLRLNFGAGAATGTPFAGQDKVKLVTHCRSGQSSFENNTLDEYTAYRIFNLISDIGYRVRLLRIQYEDTDERLRHLERPYYGFVIESDDELAARVGGNIEKTPGVLYSSLDPTQTARMNVFQYLIANTDWSFVSNLEEEFCCHNLDFIAKEGRLFPVPYDFDLSGTVNASYAQGGNRRKRVTSRTYSGYCRSQIGAVAAALDEIVALRGEILAAVEAVPVVGRNSVEARVQYIDRFFEEAVDDREKLLEQFEKDCIGRR
jgi:hypothetical protein